MTIIQMNRLNLNAILVMLILALSGCNIDRDRAVNREKFTFATGDDTELFFKNVRQSAYDKEVNEASGFQIFRHRDRINSDSLPVLNLAIVLNILKDEAYLFLEPSQPLSGEEELVVFATSDSGAPDTLRLSTQNRDTYLEFASQIYEGIQQGAGFHIRQGDTWVPILADKDEREVFRITISDYYRLTRIY